MNTDNDASLKNRIVCLLHNIDGTTTKDNIIKKNHIIQMTEIHPISFGDPPQQYECSYFLIWDLHKVQHNKIW